MSAPPPPEWDRLLSACQKNDVDLVRRLVSEDGVSPSHCNRAGQSALHIAALWGHCKYLYSSGMLCSITLLLLGLPV
jgi:ankyrin repeat protein